MAWIRLSLLILVPILAQSVAQNTKSFAMSIMNGWQFQCATTTCLPYATATTSNIFQCQTSCLGHIQCKAASFHQSNSSCQLFDNMPNQNNSLESTIGTITMMVISGTRTPAEPTTTSTTTSTPISTTTTTTTSTTPIPDEIYENLEEKDSSHVGSFRKSISRGRSF
ncbi:hypothetical protein I4U23_005031 [Adineta vaga]|nr:hypothetical protein I4U23_005031 [Adineta vaga]